MFGHVQGTSHSAGGSASAVSATLGAAPTLGNLVCVALVTATAVTALSVKDANNNVYTVTTNSPSTVQSGAGQVWLAYLLSAPSNASAVINLTWTTATNPPIVWADEFSISGGTCAFDKDAKNNSAASSTTISTPTITPIGAGELLYSGAAAGGAITAPTAGAVSGSWTGSAGAITNGDMAEYILSSGTGAIAVHYIQSSGTWSAMAMAFSITASFIAEDDTPPRNCFSPFDNDVTVWQ